MRWIGPLLFVTLAAFGARAWFRAELKIPLFIHVLGVVGLATGGWMAYLDSSTGELTLFKAVVEVTIMPWLVYVGFFAYSGRLRDKLRPPNPPDNAV